jgi:hypothetical protein
LRSQRFFLAAPERQAFLARQIQQAPPGSVRPSTNTQFDGATNSLQDAQLLLSLDALPNLTAALDSLTFALASLAGSRDAAAIPPTSTALRET